MFSKISSAALVLAAARLALAQTSTTCQPLTATCPDDPAFCSTVTIDFRSGANSDFQSLSSGVSYDKSNGALFSITKDTDSPTFRTYKYIMFGRVDVEIWAAQGAGIVTSMVLESDDLDEIDWEWVGGNNAAAQSNYFSKGDDSTYDRGATHAVSNPLGEFHTYSIDWTKDKVDWIIDGAVVRTLAYNGDKFPQTPMQLKLGTWVAGKASNPQGTIDWAGGLANFANAPFNAWYRTVKIQDYTTCPDGSVYHYGDHTGTYSSIQVKQGNGTVTNPNSSSSSTTTTTTSTTTSSTMATSTTPASNATTTKASTPATSTTAAPTPNSGPKSMANFAFLAAALYLACIAL